MTLPPQLIVSLGKMSRVSVSERNIYVWWGTQLIYWRVRL